jgi:GTPase SAR1 family protein
MGTNIILLMGLSNAGKTTLSQKLLPLLREDGYRVDFFTDKDALDRQVLADVNRYRHNVSRRLANGGIRGDHSIVYNPDGAIGTLSIEFIDGTGLNDAHTEMLKDAKHFAADGKDGKRKRVYELAYGGDVPYANVPLLNAASWLFREIRENGLTDKVLVLDVRAFNYDERETRNTARIGSAVQPKEFKLYFGEEGYPTAQDVAPFGDRYRQIPNFGIDDTAKAEFHAHIISLYRQFIRPHLEGTHGEKEALRPSRRERE